MALIFVKQDVRREPQRTHAGDDRGFDAARAETPQDKTLELLRRRLASGAITAQQYEEHKTLLDRDA